MKFQKIKKESKVFPGEYLLHTPSNQIVLVGAFNYDEDFIKCLNNGKLMTDKVNNFMKIEVTKKESKIARTRCKVCSGA